MKRNLQLQQCCSKSLTITMIIFMMITTFSCRPKPPKDYLHETKEQIDARMKWWHDARFGMFIHWGIYSVPAGQYKGQDIPGIGEWIMSTAKIPITEYEPFGKAFNPVKFNAQDGLKLQRMPA